MEELKEKAKELSFEERYKAFKAGKAEAPILHKTVGVKFVVNETEKMVVLTIEQKDSDGEIVKVDGGKIRNPKVGIPMIDSHNSWSSVVQNGLGAIRKPRFTVVDGKKALVGEPDFAPTPAGEIAKILYMGVNGGKPYFTDVSMGFMVYDYDNETKTITEWEIFELSLVTAGANRGARFIDKKSLKVEEAEEPTEEDVQIAKDLARFKQINEPFKEFCKLFLDDEFCKLVGYKKDGDLLIDINSLYDIIYTKFSVTEEDPLKTKEAPDELVTPAVSPEMVQKVLLDTISEKLQQIS
jgi:hypothetical protein